MKKLTNHDREAKVCPITGEPFDSEIIDFTSEYLQLLLDLQVVEYWVYNKPFEYRHEWDDEWQKRLDFYLKRKHELENEMKVFDN